VRLIQHGSTDKSVKVRVLNADGTPKTDVVWNSSGLDLWYQREGAAVTSITEATLASAGAAHSDGGFIHLGGGYCRLDLPDAAFASGVDGVMVAGVITGGVVVGCYVQLVAYNPQDAVRMGMTALPNAVPTATGGLLINKRGGTAQAGAGSSITLDSGASSSNDFYNGDVACIVSGTGAGQARVIVDYVGSTKVATVDAAWNTNPSSDSVFVLIPQGLIGLTPSDIPSVEDMREEMDDNSTKLAAILEDTGTTLPGALSTIAGYLDTEIAAILEDTGTTIPAAIAGLDGKLDTVIGHVDGIPADVLDASNGVETGVTLRQALRLILSAAAGKLSGADSTTITIRNVGDTKNRIVATVDANGNRSAVTTDAT